MLFAVNITVEPLTYLKDWKLPIFSSNLCRTCKSDNYCQHVRISDWDIQIQVINNLSLTALNNKATFAFFVKNGPHISILSFIAKGAW